MEEHEVSHYLCIMEDGILFSDLNLNKPLLNALEDMGFAHPTAIQHQVFSVVMSGKDVIGTAQTGTGKTLAYLLPLLRQWQFTKDKHPSILILVPTRELVAQVENECRELSAYMNVRIAGVFGGVNLKQHTALIQEGVDVLIATPGRLMDLVLNGALRLKSIKKLVIDEVDELLNLGFLPQLNAIFEVLPERRQNIMFSATMTDEVQTLLDENFNQPVKVEATAMGAPSDKIDQAYFRVPNFLTKVNLLVDLLQDKEEFRKVMVFAESKSAADIIFEITEQTFGLEVGVIHSNKSQNARFATVEKFDKGELRVLIGTDVIARGIDVENVSHVINMDVPETPELYFHRIGRTGRGNSYGVAITLVAPYEEENWDHIESYLGKRIDALEMPEDIEIDSRLLPDEQPKSVMPNLELKNPSKINSQGAFQEKLGKNLKVNMHMTRSEKMKLKYGKPKKRRNN